MPKYTGGGTGRPDKDGVIDINDGAQIQTQRFLCQEEYKGDEIVQYFRTLMFQGDYVRI